MTDDDLIRAAMLWRNNIDTYTIARLLQLDEHEVYNHIEQIRKIAGVQMPKRGERDV